MTQTPNIYSQGKSVGQQGSPLTRGLVVCVQDPLKQGRVQVRVVGHHDDEQMIPDDKLPWIKVVNGTMTPSLQGAGVMHGVLPGSMVGLNGFGEQDWIVSSTIPNDKEDQDQSLPSAAHGKGNTDNVAPASKGSTAQKGDGTHGWSKEVDKIYNNKTTQGAKELRKNGRKPRLAVQDRVKHAKEEKPVPSHYGNRKVGKDLKGGTISTTKFPGAKDAQKFIKQTIQNKSAIVPNALAALEKLKNVKGNPTSIQSIGAGNFAAIMQTLGQLFGAGGGGQKTEEQLMYDCEALKKMASVDLTDELREQLKICMVLEEEVLKEGLEEPAPEETEQTEEIPTS